MPHAQGTALQMAMGGTMVRGAEGQGAGNPLTSPEVPAGVLTLFFQVVGILRTLP